MRFRRLLSAFACLALLALSRAAAADLEFVRVWPGWKDAASFDRISEYFTGREETGGRVVLRTHPEARAGFYFLVRIENSTTAKTGATFALHVITPASPEPVTYTFPTNVPPRSTLYQLGLTGADWPGSDTHPVAWKLELLSADRQVLAEAQSFLWSKPAR